MTMPVITATYLRARPLYVPAFGSCANAPRQQDRFRDGDNVYLRSAIRAHAHFAEYVPIIIIMNALLEMEGASAAQRHVLLGTLTVSRVLHPLACTRSR
jgi:uncharacterized membrane protein YecN with MAPEG domain